MVRKTGEHIGLDIEQLDGMAERLHAYDVRDGGWVHEDKGYEFNEKHVLTHLISTFIGKQFNNPETVRQEIAPDMAQYAIRFARWTGLDTEDVLTLAGNNWRWGRSLAQVNSGVKAELLYVIDIVNGSSHSHDHEDLREVAVQAEPHTALKVGGILLSGAAMQADVHNFDLVEAFDSRITVLRERFDVPELV